jgi:coenzyme F420-0:L-glutamate ligase / coenzyme F420-1:gamma-L-glutamate ligase
MHELTPLQIYPLRADVQSGPFDLLDALAAALERAGFALAHGDILAVSSKYAAISEGRVVELATVNPSPEAVELAARYNMNPRLVQLVMQEADHIFGGIQLGFLLTNIHGIISPNAGLDRSNIPGGYAVLFPKDPYGSAARFRREVRDRFGTDVGVILTDSWLMPGRLGTSGVALAAAGFRPLADERGKADLFGNPMQVTQRGVADSLCVAAQLVMGERDEATPFAVLRNTGVPIEDVLLSPADVSIEWQHDIYIESLTTGALDR